MGLEDAESWAAWLVENNYTPALVRSEIVDSLIENELARQGAEEAGVTASDEEVDAYIEFEKEQAGGEEAWLEYIGSLSFAEDIYRSYVKDALTYQHHLETFEDEAVIPEKDLISYGEMLSASYDGAKPDACFEVIHILKMGYPLGINDAQHHFAGDLTHGILA